MNLRDAVYGFAVGDALGVPFEFEPRGSFECTGMTGFGTWNQPPGTWSDDTSMVLATCESIKENKGINVDDIAKRFHKWWFESDYSCNGWNFDIGNTTHRAIMNWIKTGDVFSCGCTGEMDNGNGGLMRILPLAFVNHRQKDIDNVCGITHNTPISKTACSIYLEAMIAENLNEIDLAFYAHDYGFDNLRGLSRRKESEIKSTGYVVDTLEAALWCFMTTDNYRDCVLKAVNLGGDTDTIAALAGGLAGAKYGFDAIPPEWIEQLRNKEMIERCLF